MNFSALAPLGKTLRNGLAATSDFVARLSFWRFVGLCLLLLITAAIASEVIFGKEEKRHRAQVKITQDAGGKIIRRQGKEPVEVRIDHNGISIRRLDTAASTAPASGDPAVKLPPLPPLPPVPHASRTTDADLEELAQLFESPKSRDDLLVDIVLLLILGMIILRLVASARQRAEARASAAEEAALCETLSRQLAESRLQAMQAQVEPHFLFNTLAAVEHLIETDPGRAAVMQRNLIGYLRSVLPNLRRSDSTLGREVEICRHYLEILQMRMEERLEYRIDVPAGLESAQMPPLMLQSLVENAIRHGIEPRAEGGQVVLSARVADGHLVVQVDDTGVGFGAAPASSRSDGGLGLTNIRERLQALFGNQAGLHISPNSPHGTSVRIELPYAVAKAPDRAYC